MSIAGAAYAVAIEEIVEVLPMVESRPIPAAPSWLLGAINRRGRLLPLIDGGLLLGGAAVEPRRSSRVVLIRVDEAAERIVGLLVEATGALAEIDFSAPGTHPGLAVEGGEHLGALAPAPAGPVQSLRLSRALGADGWRALFGRIDGDGGSDGGEGAFAEATAAADNDRGSASAPAEDQRSASTMADASAAEGARSPSADSKEIGR
ncbi:MAG TPA: chemotaxis protein CheW [Phycisphaerales bacterium]|nr:chemotaxis protein CheW [Phycisphaerales bacterium]HMP38235.1 chemotaxis protein CheW [Phycisphaerales bacterium]